MPVSREDVATQSDIDATEPHLDPETCFSFDKQVCPSVCWGCR